MRGLEDVRCQNDLDATVTGGFGTALGTICQLTSVVQQGAIQVRICCLNISAIAKPSTYKPSLAGHTGRLITAC